MLIFYRAKPVHYHVSLFNLELGGSWSYNGVVKIDIRVISSIKEIVLNAKEIDIQAAEIYVKNGSC